MRWRDQLIAADMSRVAVVAPTRRLRRVLVELADAGVFEPDPITERDAGSITASDRRWTAAESAHPQLSVDPIDTSGPLDGQDVALIVGEASIERHRDGARSTELSAILPGWIQTTDIARLRKRLEPFGGAITPLQDPPGVPPPTAANKHGPSASVRPLVDTYATVPYRDIDPSLLAAGIYMIMFGMMFGDVGHGLALALAGLAARRPRFEWLRGAHEVWVFLFGAGVAAIVFGFLYGEAFGPTGLVPTLWLEPLEEAQTLLVAGLVVGCMLMGMTFVLAIVNRWREDGLAGALYSSAGIGGALLFAGGGVTVGGVVTSASWLVPIGIVIAAAGFALTFVGLFAAAGRGPSGFGQALIEMFDTVLRLGSNIVSFTRLAAFGLTHAVITGVVWDGTTGLWHRSGLLSVIAAAVLFLIGNIVAFGLGVLVAAIQAMRLEYYELFSRVFVSEGRPFQPWHIPIQPSETP